jgi:hypothetical protein
LTILTKPLCLEAASPRIRCTRGKTAKRKKEVMHGK